MFSNIYIVAYLKFLEEIVLLLAEESTFVPWGGFGGITPEYLPVNSDFL